MKLVVLIYLLYFIYFVNGSFIEYILKKLNLRRADFSCPNSMPQQFIGVAVNEIGAFSTHPLHHKNLGVKENEILKPKELKFVTKKIFNNIEVVKFRIKDIGSNVGSSIGILLYFCSGTSPMNDVYSVIKDFKNEDYAVQYIDQAISCTIDICRVGLYINQVIGGHGDITTRVKESNSFDKSYYLVFEPDEEHKGIYFAGISGDFFPLVPCPYYNWVATAFLTRYHPKDYIIKGGQSGGDHFYDTNIFVPAFSLTRSEHDKTHFICGELIQETVKNVEVGFNVKPNNLEHSLVKGKEIEMKDGKITCDGKELDQKSSFGYVDSKDNLMSGKSEVLYFGEGFKFYHNQIVLVYDNAPARVVRHRRFWEIFNDKSFENYSPKCAGYVIDVKMEFTLELNKKETLDVNMKKRKNGEEVPVVYMSSKHIESGKVDARCRGIKAGGRDARFDDFFEISFKTKLQKVVDPNLKVNDQPVLSELIISSESDDVFGLYSCELDCSNCEGKKSLADRNIILLPKELFTATVNVKAYSDSKDILSCPLEVNNVGELRYMNVLYKGQTKISYDVVKDSPADIFKKNETSINYTGNKHKLTDGTIVECNYTAFNSPYMLQKKVIQYNELRDQKDHVGSKILVPIIIAVGVAIFVIIIIIILVTLRIIKRRKKIKLLSQATSASGASSMSKSEFTRSSMTKSSSTSKTKRKPKKSKSSASKSKNSKSAYSSSLSKGSKSKSKTGSFAG
uniref:Uncharacterized protein n=1 Tax=Strongyloides stercoralis TaxID=6248 RepID=A0A0K0EMH7_STRER